MYRIVALATVLALNAQADGGPTNQDARAILDRVLSTRPTKDFSLKARLFVGSADPIAVEILTKNTADETRTIYRGGQTEALVVQPVRGQPRFYLRGAGELTGARRTEKLLGSHFTYYALGLPFLHWPNAKFLGEERVRARDCFAIESRAEGEPYARVKMYIDKEYYALLRAEAFDATDNLVSRFAVTSFKKIGELWVPRGSEVSFVPAGQSLPSQEKSRLEVYEGKYDAVLPGEMFAAERFRAIAD
jgi:hypothetical protein